MRGTTIKCANFADIATACELAPPVCVTTEDEGLRPVVPEEADCAFDVVELCAPVVVDVARLRTASVVLPLTMATSDPLTDDKAMVVCAPAGPTVI